MSEYLTSKTNPVLVEFRDDDIWGQGDNVLDHYILILESEALVNDTPMPWANERSREHALKVLTRLKAIFPLDPPKD